MPLGFALARTQPHAPKQVFSTLFELLSLSQFVFSLRSLSCLSASSAVPMTVEELEKHLNLDETQPAETPDVDPRRNRHLFVDSDGNKWIRAGVVFGLELPPAYLRFENQDGEGRFYTKTVRIESRTVACTENKTRIVVHSLRL